MLIAVFTLFILNFVSTLCDKLRIVYVYTVVPAVCKHGLPSYIRVSLEQAIISQPDAEVVIASNFGECLTLDQSVSSISGLTKVDAHAITSNRTRDFRAAAVDIFQMDYSGELWITSALRFFMMEDVMKYKGYSEMMHVEADNLLYGNLTALLPVLREGYPTLAATPLNSDKSFTTASVLWIANLRALEEFNDYLLGMGNSTTGTYRRYLKWLRPFACCKQGGVDQDERGNGIKPFAVNEMSMLSHYHHIEPDKLLFFPIVPEHNFSGLLLDFTPLGAETGPPTGAGIWDPNSWGQYLGGTANKKGRNKKFYDISHIVGQIFRYFGECTVHMVCADATYSSSFRHPLVNASALAQCVTAPFVRCGEGAAWTPLWNLHVHSKHTVDFASKPCVCDAQERIQHSAAHLLGGRAKARKRLPPVATTPFTNNFAQISLSKLPVVYVYTMVGGVCKYGLPDYIRVSLEQALVSQPDADVVMVGNFGECATLLSSVASIPRLLKVDASALTSNRTKSFKAAASNIFQSDGHGELWITSALRFFMMEDVMKATGYTEMMHVEADNLLYGNLTALLSVLREGYPTLAATPLNSEKSLTTASVLWIANLRALEDFNDYLLRLASNADGEWTAYLRWLRPFACCKQGGVDPDKEGNGIKPFAVNEMSMLSHYHQKNSTALKFLPIVPTYKYFTNRYVCNMSEFGPDGREVGPPTGLGVWDPNSWGQYLGGTSNRKGRDKQFTDPTHVIGQALRLNGECKVAMVCANATYSSSFRHPLVNASALAQCVTAPFVRCGEGSAWTPLWNLHVHSKHTVDFASKPCVCDAADVTLQLPAPLGKRLGGGGGVGGGGGHAHAHGKGVHRHKALVRHDNASLAASFLVRDSLTAVEHVAVRGERTGAAAPRPGSRLPVTYVFTVVPAICKDGLPDYIRVSLEQALVSQPDADVVMVGNFGECATTAESVDAIKGVIKVDSTSIASNRTKNFTAAASNIFQSDGYGELWITSALRFFMMEDVMKATGYSEMMHVEADNLLYGNLTALLPVLREGYPTLAATPLNSDKSFTTASVLWIANLRALEDFNDFLLRLGSNENNEWKNYLIWLRRYACCRYGGIDPDPSGLGIKPFAVNEMSMLSYYHAVQPQQLQFLPIVPRYNYYLNRYVCNMSEFGPDGREVGPPTGLGVWDPNSWGQYLGGTHFKKGRDKQFTDPTHVIGQALRLNSECKVAMVCANTTYSSSFRHPLVNASAPAQCVTAPFVRCGEGSAWTPLWNLHVHSKHTVDFASKPCVCKSS